MNTASTTETADRALIPRRVLFGDPDRMNVALSPDGTLLAYAAPHDGVMNLWTQPLDTSAPARPVTTDQGRGITNFTLCAENRIVYAQDTEGDENWRLYLLDLRTGQSRLITPERGAHARLLAYHPFWHPGQMLITLNARNPQLHDVCQLDLATGELTETEANPGHDAQPPFAAWLADADLNVRGGAVPTPDGGVIIRIRGRADGPYRTLTEIPGDDFHPHHAMSLTRDGTALITATSLGAPATRLTRIDLASGHLTTLSSDPHHDLAGVWCDPDTLEPAVATYAPDRTRYHVLDPAFASDIDRLTHLNDGDAAHRYSMGGKCTAGGSRADTRKASHRM